MRIHYSRAAWSHRGLATAALAGGMVVAGAASGRHGDRILGLDRVGRVEPPVVVSRTGWRPALQQLHSLQVAIDASGRGEHLRWPVRRLRKVLWAV